MRRQIFRLTQHPIVQTFPQKENYNEQLKQYLIKNVVGNKIQQRYMYDKNTNLEPYMIMLKPPKNNETIRQWIKRNYMFYIP